MAPRKIKKPLEPADKTPLGWAKWWFAMGCQEAGTLLRLRAECGLTEAEAQACFEEMITKLKAEVELARQQVEVRAVAFFRDLKNDVRADWSSRLRAEIELEELLGLADLAQSAEGRQTREVLEAMAFHHHLQQAPDVTAGQRLRSYDRLLKLLGFTHRRSRRASHGPSLSRAPSSGISRGADVRRSHEPVSTSGTKRTDDAPACASPAHDNHDERAQSTTHTLPPPATPENAAVCQHQLAELEREAESLEAELERLVARGVPASQARRRLGARIQANSRRRLAVISQLAGRPAAQLSAHLCRGKSPPAALAQPPPR